LRSISDDDVAGALRKVHKSNCTKARNAPLSLKRKTAPPDPHFLALDGSTVEKTGLERKRTTTLRNASGRAEFCDAYKFLRSAYCSNYRGNNYGYCTDNSFVGKLVTFPSKPSIPIQGFEAGENMAATIFQIIPLSFDFLRRFDAISV